MRRTAMRLYCPDAKMGMGYDRGWRGGYILKNSFTAEELQNFSAKAILYYIFFFLYLFHIHLFGISTH